MSERVMDHPVIDIDEFERRLRGPAPRPAGDPLAELARLVSTSPEKPNTLDAMFARREPAAPAPAPAANYAPRVEMPAHPVSYAEAHDGYAAAENGDWGADETEAPVYDRPRSKKPIYLAMAVIALGATAVGAFTFKHRAGPSGLVEVKAAPGPTKVQAQAAPNSNAAQADASVLERGAPAPAVTRVIDRHEKPVNLTDAAKSARAEPPPGATAPVGPVTLTSNPPVFGEPRKVKTVSVRPDGTVLAAASASAAQPRDATASVSAKPTTPPTTTATPKVAARVATTPKPEAADKDAAKATPPVRPKPAAAKPEPVRTASAAEDVAEKPAPVSTASGGSYSVQLAAPATEAEARTVANKLARQYAAALGPARLTFKKAADKEVYRVRAAGLSQEAATAACEKVKAAGGACFVAKN